MKLSRPSLEQTPHPRPTPAVEVLLDINDEQDDGVEFDPQRDIRPKDWEGMKGRLEEYRGAKDWLLLGYMTRNLALLFPDRIPNRTSELDLDEAFTWMEAQLEAYRKIWNWQDFGAIATPLSFLFPDRTPEIKLDDRAFQGMQSKLERDRNAKDWQSFSQMALRLSILFPDRKAKLRLDNEAFEWMKGTLEWLRSLAWWREFSTIAMRLALLFPDHKDELKLDDEAFEGMKSELEKNRGKDWWTFSDVATNLTILAADSAQITHDGRILITPKRSRLSPDPKPLPKQSRL